MTSVLSLLQKAVTRLNAVTISRPLSAKFESQPYELYKLDTAPSTNVELTSDDALNYYRQMHLIRKTERAVGTLYEKKQIAGFCHLYTGQEAVSVGIRAHMRPQDDVVTSYRCHGWLLLLGIMEGKSEEEVVRCTVSELTGKGTGWARGKGGSMHMYCKNFYGGNGIVGAQVPLGAGMGLAHQYKKDGGIAISLYGDGASNQGQLFEAFNIAKLLSIPVLFVAENNTYSMGTSIKRGCANTNLYQRGDAVPGVRMDGMDVLSVREGVRFCFDHILSGKGPILLELMTYRYFGHSMSDPGTSYRTREEVKKVRDQKDPIKILHDKIISAKLASEEDLSKIDKETKSVVDKGVKAAAGDKVIDAKEVAYDVYADYKGKVNMGAYMKFFDHKNAGVIKAVNMK